ncbi:MAG: methylated-DNA--[protein]-cysteine S-methyltransferase [Anaerolineaceae bacterium]
METALTPVVAETVLGWAGVALSKQGIRYATLFHRNRTGVEGELAAFGASPGTSDPRNSEIEALLQGYASDASASLDDYPVDLPECTELQRDIWLALREIPRGETRSYGWLARRVGHPSAARAVGAAVGSNPIPLWLPCHRVVASDGTLHGFGGGLAMKQALLELEGALPRQLPVG